MGIAVRTFEKYCYKVWIRLTGRIIFLFYKLDLQYWQPQAVSSGQGSYVQYRHFNKTDWQRLVQDSQAEISLDFMKDATSRGYKAFGAFSGSGDCLGYTFYALPGDEVPLTDELAIRIKANAIYFYKGLTFKKYRGQGIYGELIEYLLAEQKAQGRAYAISLVFSHNFPSRKVYKKLGFGIVGFFIRAYGERQDKSRLILRDVSLLGFQVAKILEFCGFRYL